MNPPNLTPMMKQYLLIKEAHPDAILFFRMGDFYEMFFEDAKVASRLLEITLTSRNKNDSDAVPMCGVPIKAARVYIGRLLSCGKKVAVCDQLEDAALAKGLVKRDVVRVITPGTIIENDYLDEKTDNSLLSIAVIDAVFGIASMDISTGSFRVTETDKMETAMDEILRIAPNEILIPLKAKDKPESFSVKSFEPIFSNRAVTYLEDRNFSPTRGREQLAEQFDVFSLDGFGCGHMTAGIGAAGALLEYVRENQKQPVGHITRLEPYAYSDALVIDDLSCKNLELTENLWNQSRDGTLLSVMDKTSTAMGARLLRRFMRYPAKDVREIETRLDAVAEARTKMPDARQIRGLLSDVSDLERLGSKIVLGHANARDLIALKRSINALRAIFQVLSRFQSLPALAETDLEILYKTADRIESAICDDPAPTLHEGGMIKEGYHPELDELLRISRDGRSYLARLESEEKQATGISSLKVRYNKVFGYYIEVPRSHSEAVPPRYVRKQTLVNAERYITDELKAFELKVFNAQEQRAEMEFELFNEIRSEVASINPRIQSVAKSIARLDVLINFAEIADRNRYIRPVIVTDGSLRIDDGRHPMVEKKTAAGRFVPNSIRMDQEENQILLITGPNMAGKSTLLRQAALIVLMAHMGSFVPASAANIPLTDRIFTRVGALDNLSQGQSTFMVEMQETANIVNNATQDSLIILDEIGRGTSTFDGLSIAWAVAEHLHDLKGKGVKTLFATHYHELTALSESHPRIKNFNVAVKEWNDEIIFLRKLVEGGTNRSYGIQVARLAGIPKNVIERAKEILMQIENRSAASLQDNRVGKNAPSQLSLFKESSSYVTERLKKIDILNMTPVDALVCLSEMKKKLERPDDG